MKNLVLFVCAGLVLAACGGGSGLATGGDYSVAAALHEIPAIDVGDGPIQISTADIKAATELSDLTRPEDVNDDDVLLWTSGLTAGRLEMGVPVFVPFAQVFGIQIMALPEIETELGWSILDVDSFVELNTPPHMFTVAEGDFEENPLTAEGLIDLGNGVVSAGEGDDGTYELENTTPARPRGQPLRMAHENGRVATSWSTPAVEDWLGETEETYADNERLLAVAETLDNADVVSAYLAQGSFNISEGLPLSPEQLEELSGQIVPEAFDTVGIGWAVTDDGESQIEVAYHFSDEAAAVRAMEPLRTVFETGETLRSQKPFSELLTLNEISNEGAIVAVTFQPGPEGHVRTVLEMFAGRDLPFSHR